MRMDARVRCAVAGFLLLLLVSPALVEACHACIYGKFVPCKDVLYRTSHGVETYRMRHHRLPDRLADLERADGFLSIPTCPYSGLPLGYERDASTREFTVVCRGFAHRYWLGNKNLACTSRMGLREDVLVPPPTAQEDALMRRLDLEQAAKLRALFLERYLDVARKPPEKDDLTSLSLPGLPVHLREAEQGLARDSTLVLHLIARGEKDPWADDAHLVTKYMLNSQQVKIAVDVGPIGPIVTAGTQMGSRLLHLYIGGLVAHALRRGGQAGPDDASMLAGCNSVVRGYRNMLATRPGERLSYADGLCRLEQQGKLEEWLGQREWLREPKPRPALRGGPSVGVHLSTSSPSPDKTDRAEEALVEIFPPIVATACLVGLCMLALRFRSSRSR